MKVIITEEQLEYITKHEIISESNIDEFNIAKGLGKFATNASEIIGQLLKNSKNKAFRRTGLRLTGYSRKGMPKKGAIRTLDGQVFRFDGTKWKTLTGGDVEKIVRDPNIIRQLNSTAANPVSGDIRKIGDKYFRYDGANWMTHDTSHALNTQRKVRTGAERIGNATKWATRGAIAGGIGYGTKKIYDKSKEAIEGFRDYEKTLGIEHPDAPQNTDYLNTSDALKSMGLKGDGESILTPKNSESLWGKIYDKYGKNQ